MVDGTFDNVYTNNLYPLSGNTTININNLISLPTQGPSGGLLIGGDTNLYRSSANYLVTDDSFGCLQLYVGDVSYNVKIANSAPYIYFGDRSSAWDTNLYRGDANVLTTDDSFCVLGTKLSIGGVVGTNAHLTINKATPAISLVTAASGDWWHIAAIESSPYGLSFSTGSTVNSLVTFTMLPTGILNIPASGGGLSIGGDITLYRSGSNTLLTNADFVVSKSSAILSLYTPDATDPQVRFSSNSTLKFTQGFSHAYNFVYWYDAVAEATLMSLAAAGQLALPIQGSAGGLLIGGDTTLYRSAPDALKTDDTFEVATEIKTPIYNIRSSDGSYVRAIHSAGTAPTQHFHFIADYTKQTGSTIATAYFGFNSEINAYAFMSKWSGTNTQLLEINYTGQLILPLTGSSAGLLIGGDTNLYRSATAETLKTDDNFSALAVLGANGLFVNNAFGDKVNNAPWYGIGFSNVSSGSGNYTQVAGYYGLKFKTATGDINMTTSGQLQLPTQGSSGGLVIGEDTNLYRSAPNTLHTNGSLEVGGSLTVNGTPVLTSGSTVSLSGLSVDGSVSFLGGLAYASFSINQGTVTTIANSLDDGAGNASWGGYHSFKDTGLVLNVHRNGLDEGSWKNEELTNAYSYNWGQTYPPSDYEPLPCLWVTKVSPQDRSSAYREAVGNQQFFMDPMLSTNYAFFVEKDFATFGHVATSSDPQKQSGGGAIMMGQGWLGEGCPPIFSLTGTEILLSDVDAQHLYPGASGTTLPTPTGNRAKYYRTDKQILYQDTPLFDGDGNRTIQRWQPLGTAGKIGGYPSYSTDPVHNYSTDPIGNPVHYSFYYNTTTKNIRQYQLYQNSWQWRDVYTHVVSSDYDTLFLVRADTSALANVYLGKMQCNEIYNAQNDWVEINTKLNLNGNFQLNGNVATSLNPLTSGLALGSPDEYWLGVVSASFNPRDTTQQASPYIGKIKFDGTNNRIVFRNETDTGYISLDPNCVSTISYGMTSFCNQNLNQSSDAIFNSVTGTSTTAGLKAGSGSAMVTVRHDGSVGQVASLSGWLNLSSNGGVGIYGGNLQVFGGYHVIPEAYEGGYVGNSSHRWYGAYIRYIWTQGPGGTYDTYDDLELVKQWGEPNPVISEKYDNSKLKPPTDDLFAFLRGKNADGTYLKHDCFELSSLGSFALGCAKALAKKQDEHSAILLQLLNDKEVLETKCQLLQEQIEKLKEPQKGVNMND